MTKHDHTLAIVVPDLFHSSVTFFHEHIKSIWPGKTVVVHLSSTGEVAMTDAPTLEVPAPKPIPELSLPVISTAIRQFNTWHHNRLPAATQWKVMQFFADHEVTHIFAEFATSGSTILPVAKQLDLPLSVMSHGWDINVVGQMPQWQWRYRKLFKSGAQLIAVVPFLRDRMVEIGAPREQIAIIPCAVDAKAFTPTSHPADGKVRVVMVSRLIAQKGPLLALEAYLKAAEEVKELHLDIVGNGPLMEQVKQAVASSSVADRIEVHGDVSHHTALSLIDDGHIFLQHCVSLHRQGIESQAVSLLEAMGFGLVPIVTRHGGMESHAKDGVRGWLVEEGDTSAMAERIVTMARDSETRTRIGKEARRYVLDHFSPEIVHPRLRQIIGLSPS